MRVALDATPLLGSRTGIAAVTGGLFRALAGDTRVEPVAYAMSLRGVPKLRGVLPRGVEARLRPMPAAVVTRAWAHLDVPRAEMFTGAVDVVHGTNYVVPPTARAGAVVTVYDLTAVRYPEMVERVTLRYPALVKRAVARGALVHVTARAIGDEVVELLRVPADRVHVVMPGADPVTHASCDAARGRRLAGAERYVLAIGTVEPRKGLVDLVAAFDRIAGDAARRDVALVVAGADGWGSAVDDLLAAVDRSPHRRRVRRLGWVDDATRGDLLAGATVVATPSRYEGFGYTPLEAMSAGVPVVATTAGSLPEVLGQAALLVPPGDVDALAGAIAHVVDDENERCRLVAAGRERAASFRWDACVDGMVRLYEAAAEACGVATT
ncbi:MAG TPA: glycosyltransferase family 1 protein [Acidimicrobiales bacterium]